MTQKNSRKIVWIDVETSGLAPEQDSLLEIAAVVTDISGKNQSNHYQALFDVGNLSKVLNNTSETVKRMHEKSKLWQDLWSNKTKPARVIESELVEWLNSVSEPEDILYFGGNSITLDRNFVRLNLPEFYKMISYRSVDVTSLSLSIQSHTNVNGYMKKKAHRALSDILESIDEYKYYIDHLEKI